MIRSWKTVTLYASLCEWRDSKENRTRMLGAGQPTRGDECSPLLRITRAWRLPRASVSSTGDSSHILISRSMRPSLIRRETDFI
jgi:hypothetical protein